jgi:hypothetical protein
MCWWIYSWKTWDVQALFDDVWPAEAVSLDEVGLPPGYLDSIAERSSCIPILEETNRLFGNKAFPFTVDLRTNIRKLEERLFARLRLEELKGLRPYVETQRKTRQSRQLSLRLRDLILRQDKHRCIFCGRTADQTAVLEVNHIIPIALVKRLKLDEKLIVARENLCTTCFDCNRGKSDNLAPEDIEFYIGRFSHMSQPNHAIVPYLEQIRTIQEMKLQ